MRRPLNVLVLAAASAFVFASQPATAMQSAGQTGTNAVSPQVNSQASSHDRHHHRNSASRHHRHHHKAVPKH